MKVKHDKMEILDTDGEIDAIVKVGTYVTIEEDNDPKAALNALMEGINKKRREQAEIPQFIEVDEENEGYFDPSDDDIDPEEDFGDYLKRKGI